MNKNNLTSELESIFLKLLNAEVANEIDNLPCKAIALRSHALILLADLVQTDLTLEQQQMLISAKNCCGLK